MTAKEEAKQLVEKFENEIGQSDFHIPKFISGIECADGSDEYGRILDDETRDLAKQCALVCVDWHIKEFVEVCSDDILDNIEYWEAVKEEIKNV